jgi:hypothetical protein
MSDDPADVFIPEVVCLRVLGEEVSLVHDPNAIDGSVGVC